MDYYFYIISLFLIVTVILKLNNYHLIDNNLLFLILTNYLLNFSTALFYYYFSNLTLSLISTLALLICTIFLIKDFRRILRFIPLRSIPYVIYIIYLTSKIFLNIFNII